VIQPENNRSERVLEEKIPPVDPDEVEITHLRRDKNQVLRIGLRNESNN
jgi:hypothetical protein